jgi:hypothetical protein
MGTPIISKQAKRTPTRVRFFMQLKKRIYRITKMEHIPSGMATANLTKTVNVCFSQ